MSARQELDAARLVVAQMELARGSENAKSDLTRVWSAVEAALRALVGGTSAGGQNLVRDARSRQLLTFDQANALVAFLAVREQLDWPDYKPTESDLNAARTAFLKLDAGLMTASAAAPAPQSSPYAPGAVPPSPAYATKTASTAASVPPVIAPAASAPVAVRTRTRVWIPIVVTAVVVALGIGAWMMFGRGGSGDLMAEAQRAYTAGDRQTAAMKFEQAARAMPDKALPHVYLSRMAREVGNYAVANQELQLALKTEPTSLEGRREYGSLFLAQGNYEFARQWYTRALEINPSDPASQGWLGCSLIKVGRIDEGMRWLGRAGNGAWSACRNAALPAAPGVSPP